MHHTVRTVLAGVEVVGMTERALKPSNECLVARLWTALAAGTAALVVFLVVRKRAETPVVPAESTASSPSAEDPQVSGDGGKGKEEVPKSRVDFARLAIPLGIAVIVGTFVALGIQGEVLARLIRNSPVVVAIAMILAVLGVTLPAFFLKAETAEQPAVARAAKLGAFLLTFGTVVAVVGGAFGIGEREQPTVQIEQQGSATSEGLVTYKITAAGTALRSVDRLLLRVSAFPIKTPQGQASNDCRIDAREPRSDGSRVLVWAEGGPSSSGTVTSTATLTVDRNEFRFLCALAAMSARTQQPTGKDARFVSYLLDLRNAAESPPSPTPDPSESPTGGSSSPTPSSSPAPNSPDSDGT